MPKVLEIRHFQKNGSSERIIFRPGRAVFVLKDVLFPAFPRDEIVQLWVVVIIKVYRELSAENRIINMKTEARALSAP